MQSWFRDACAGAEEVVLRWCRGAEYEMVLRWCKVAGAGVKWVRGGEVVQRRWCRGGVEVV